MIIGLDATEQSEGDANQALEEPSEEIVLQLMERVERAFEEIGQGIPSDAVLSPAGWSRVDERMIAAIEVALKQMPSSISSNVRMAFEENLSPLAKSFEKRSLEFRSLLEATLRRNNTQAQIASGLHDRQEKPFVSKPGAIEVSAGTPADVDSRTRVAHAHPADIVEASRAAADAQATLRTSKSNDSSAKVMGPEVFNTSGHGFSAAMRLSSEPQTVFSNQLPINMPVAVANEPQVVKQDVTLSASADLASNVLPQIRSAKVGEGRTRIELSPAHLGALEVELSSDEAGQLRVVIRAESAVTLAALRSDRQGLADLLSAEGFDFDTTHLDLESFARDERAPAREQQVVPTTEATEPSDEAPRADAEAQTSLATVETTARLDILT
ncbi:flagellar hook-length control protein FliK [Roseivivax sp. THAF40]|uniref:flagellar hook-length control protein FliK n=1 Tax=Roseivivax sp. THAF40 TaxID=2587858 RepID=UPI001562CB2E|nr:flagellar hook-length control protein FliK [Roseivivax sp. THAF40]